MKYTVVPIVLLLSNSVVAQDCSLSGVWISNEKMTLASTNESGQITEKQRDLFSKNFFGKLKFTYTCNKVTSFYDGQSIVASYELVPNAKGGYTIKSVGSDTVNSEQEIWFTENYGCYYSAVGKLNFNEYFCKSE